MKKYLLITASFILIFLIVNSSFSNVGNAKIISLKKDVMQLIDPNCDCEKSSEVLIWRFPLICMILFNFFVISALLSLQSLVESILTLAQSLHCSWVPQPP